ncbi:hypothetical protein [Hymenobacter sp. UYCo722]|uniref:hypothetical protein n=1 Tax=Hymenobacter sp. UYCo722 TaxID=3156335 RepID=UPI003395D8B1
MADRITEKPTPREASQREVVSYTREMANRLHLNEGQYLQLLPLNRTRLSTLNGINREYRTDAATRAAKAAELEAQFEQECSRILTPSQLSQLQRSAPPVTAPATTGNGLG